MALDSQNFRDLMAGVCAPVTVVTTSSEAVAYGATVSAFASLSLNPPMITVALDRASSLLTQILLSKTFGVNVLSIQQEETARIFATPRRRSFRSDRMGFPLQDFPGCEARRVGSHASSPRRWKAAITSCCSDW